MLGRRVFRTSLVALVVLPSIVRADARPNILFAFADDWGRYASAYSAIERGGPGDIISTPNFDRVAKEGVLFSNAFVNAPSCTPCRSSLLSGQYFWRTGRGAILQGAVWDETIPGYPTILQQAGYHIGYTHKVWSPGTVANAPYGGRTTAYGKRGNQFNNFSQYLSNHPNIEVGKQALLDEVRGNFNDFLSDREDDQPFCYWWGPTNCHRRWIQGSGRKLWGLNPDDLKGKLPGFLPDEAIIREDMADYLGEAMAFDAGLGVLLEELEKTGEQDNTIIVVSGDHGAPGFPHGKCNLYDFGTHVALAIRWPQCVPGNRIVHDFVCLPDLAATFVEAGGEAVPEVMTAKSLLPVLQSVKSGVVDPLRDAVITGRERHVARARDDGMPYPQRAIRTKDFLYIRNFKPNRWPMGTGPGYGAMASEMPTLEALRDNTFAAFADFDGSPTKAWIALNCEGDESRQKYFDFAFGQRPAEELYDLKVDTDQVHNVAGEERYAETVTDLAARLMKTLEETGDPRVTGDGTTFDKPPFSANRETSQPKSTPNPKKPRNP